MLILAPKKKILTAIVFKIKMTYDMSISMYLLCRVKFVHQRWMRGPNGDLPLPRSVASGRHESWIPTDTRGTEEASPENP